VLSLNKGKQPASLYLKIWKKFFHDSRKAFSLMASIHQGECFYNLQVLKKQVVVFSHNNAARLL